MDGRPLDEPYTYVSDPEYQSTPFGPVTVPAGRLWMMGDHRDQSADSRAHITDPDQGTIAVDDVIGKASLIVWPVDRFTLLDDPDIQQTSAAGAPAGTLPVRGDWVVAAPLLLGLAGAVPVSLSRRSRRVVRTRPGRLPEV